MRIKKTKQKKHVLTFYLDKDSYTEMDGTLHTDFRKSETSRDIKKYFEHHWNIFKSCINFQN